MISSHDRNEDTQSAKDADNSSVESEEIMQGKLPDSLDSSSDIAGSGQQVDQLQGAELPPELVRSRTAGWVLRPFQGPQESAFYADDIPKALKALESLGQSPSDWIFEPACISNHPLVFTESQ